MTDLMHSSSTMLAFGMPGGTEWIVLLVIGLLIFGRRLPEVGKSLGRSIVEFKKGVKGIESDVEEASSAPAPKLDTPAASPRIPDSAPDTAPDAEAASPGEGDNPYRQGESTEPTGNG